MKTLRDVLLDRRSPATPALDAIRSGVTAHLRATPDAPRHSTNPAPGCWLAWIGGWRPFWTALAAAWLVIGVLNILDRSATPAPGPGVSAPLTRAALATARQERRALDLVEETSGVGPVNPRVETSRPRTDWRSSEWRHC